MGWINRGEGLIKRLRDIAGSARERKPLVQRSEHIGHRRRDCWWDPVYDPELDGKLERGTWDFRQTAGPCEKYFVGNGLDEVVSLGETFKIVGVTFKSCDFQGVFDPKTLIMFDNCTFKKCDFAYSSWKDIHFRKCTFEECSFSLATFTRCEFRENVFQKLGLSGSKTDFERTFITNPEDLIFSGVSNTNPEDESWKHKLYQWFRLQGTQAHLSRTILSSHNLVGDDETFYCTAKIHDLQQSKAKIANNIYNIIYKESAGRFFSFNSLLSNIIENILLRFIGIMNDWGHSSIRPLMLLILSFAGFGFYYEYFTRIQNPWQKSFNITAIVGYSNEYSRDGGEFLMALQSVQASISIIVYTVFFGTIIAKLSRVR